VFNPRLMFIEYGRFSYCEKDGAHYMKESNTNLRSSAEQPWQDFINNAVMFAGQTSQHVLQGVNPGGCIKLYGVGMRLTFFWIGSCVGIIMGHYSKSTKYGIIKYHPTGKS
jgi:hypothetical protein